MKELRRANEQISDNILQRCKSGDTSAFKEIIRKYQKYAYVLAFKNLTNEEEAKDVVQETFIRVWKHIKLFNNQVKFTTWLYKIVINLCYDRLKTIRRREKVITNKIDNQEILFNQENNPEEIMSNQQLSEMIQGLAENLSYKQRIVFILRDLQELSIKEIAEVLNMSANSVKTNLVYARKNIRQKLEKHIK